MATLGFFCYLIYYLLIRKETLEMLGLKAKVTWFNSEKKFGFAVPDVVPIDVLIDLSSINLTNMELALGQRIYIEIETPDDGGFRATAVIPL
ncbi:cold shock protein CspE [Vibrio vulnificus]|nr:cold shock protein CspE [Vibrio vulnificus]OJI29319.1 cold shock protein CspE [Vibrio vulnificus]